MDQKYLRERPSSRFVLVFFKNYLLHFTTYTITLLLSFFPTTATFFFLLYILHSIFILPLQLSLQLQPTIFLIYLFFPLSYSSYSNVTFPITLVFNARTLHMYIIITSPHPLHILTSFRPKMDNIGPFSVEKTNTPVPVHTYFPTYTLFIANQHHRATSGSCRASSA